jgi:DnaJ-class molecular chaperone
MNMKKYYDILGIKEHASKEEIKKAYNKLSKELDPIKNNNEQFFEEEVKKLNEAYDKLFNSSILSAKKVTGKSNKKMDTSSSNDINNDEPNLDRGTNDLKKIVTKQNIFSIVLIILIGFNFFLLQQLKNDNSSASLTEDYMNQAEDYMNQAEYYMNQAEEYMSQSEEYMYYAEDYSNTARRYADDAYYNSN